MLKVGKVKEIYEMKGAGYSIRNIARELHIARNTVWRYLKDLEAVMPKPRRRRASKLDPFIEYMDRRLSEGLENCVVLWRELQGLGYQGGYSLVKTYVSPRRRRGQVAGNREGLCPERKPMRKVFKKPLTQLLNGSYYCTGLLNAWAKLGREAWARCSKTPVC